MGKVMAQHTTINWVDLVVHCWHQQKAVVTCFNNLVRLTRDLIVNQQTLTSYKQCVILIYLDQAIVWNPICQKF